MSSRTQKILALLKNGRDDQPTYITQTLTNYDSISKNTVSVDNFQTVSSLAIQNLPLTGKEQTANSNLSEGGSLLDINYTQVPQSVVQEPTQNELINIHNNMVHKKNETTCTVINVVESELPPPINAIDNSDEFLPRTLRYSTSLPDTHLFEETSADISVVGQSNVSLRETCQTLFTDTSPQENIMSDRYVIEGRSSTKLNLRRVNKKTYRQHTSSESEDFSSGSSDNFVPSHKSRSTSSSSSSLSSGSDCKIDSLDATNKTSDSPVKGKKRLRNVKNWAKIKAKRLKNAGKEYTTKTGNVVQARSMQPPCPDKCVLSCAKRNSEDFRHQLFKEYWEMGSLERQRGFLSSCVEKLNLKYRRVSSAVPRKPNCAFYLLNNGQKVRVCKVFLINTLGITERTLRTVIQSKISGNGMIPEDKRGKHNRHRKTNEEILNAIREHINSIPRIESHYVRSDTSRQFIDGGLSIAELYRNFSEKRRACSKEISNYDTYAKVFNTEFNIGFFAPKKDQCDLCESYKNAVDDEKEKLEYKYKEHLAEKILSREEKDKDKGRAIKQEIVLAVYDLQAVLPVPMGQTSAFYYKSRLNCFNFTVTEVGNDRTKAFFWHEGLGQRGAIEIGTCVLIYLEELSKSRPDADVVFFSDNCGGQQKNRFLIAVYLYAVHCFPINSITHKYLLRGHTQNEGDAIHSIIERSLKKSKKSGPIYVPDQYVSVIRNAKKKGNPIDLKVMGFNEFLNIKSLFDDMGLNISKNANGNDFKINDVKILHFEKNNDFFQYKTSYKQEDWKLIHFRDKTRRSEPKDIKKVIIKQAYHKEIQLSESKRQGLRSLLDGNLIPKFYKYFYDSLC